MYQWSIPPGLREESEEVSQVIRQATTSFKRTVSAMSSSSSSSTVTAVKHKKKKVNKNNPNANGSTTKNKVMPPPPLASTITICDTFDTPDKGVNQGQKTKSSDRHQSTSVITPSCSTTASSTDINTLREEIKVLREKLCLQLV